MVKTGLAIIILLAMPFLLNAQSASSLTIRVQLKLIQKLDSNVCKSIAVGLSFFNDSDEDIFIPGFLNQTRGALQIYKQSVDGSFKEIPLWGDLEDFKPSFQEGMACTGAVLPPWFNLIYILFAKSTSVLSKAQDSIFNSFIQSNRKEKYQVISSRLDRPLFLKAHQSLENYEITGLDHLLKTSAEFKLAFMMYKCDKAELFPRTIFGYKRYIPAKVESNTIYYQVIK